jgi:hypothetical protein
MHHLHLGVRATEPARRCGAACGRRAGRQRRAALSGWVREPRDDHAAGHFACDNAGRCARFGDPHGALRWPARWRLCHSNRGRYGRLRLSSGGICSMQRPLARQRRCRSRACSDSPPTTFPPYLVQLHHACMAGPLAGLSRRLPASDWAAQRVKSRCSIFAGRSTILSCGSR